LPAGVALKVFAPSSVTEVMKELGAAFEAANPGVKLAVEYGHSPTQRLQLTQGAVGDVFISASQKDMDDAITDKTVGSGTAKVFASNQLVVVLSPKSAANVQKLEDLANSGVKLLVGSDELPVGVVTQACVTKLGARFGGGYKEKVLANVVSKEPGVKPIVSKVNLGEADAGIVYVTDAATVPGVKTIAIPAEVNMVTQLNAAPIVKAAQPALAASFSAYLISTEGQAILKKWGFMAGKS
jgi:molybdate transport system substrate-binding protein